MESIKTINARLIDHFGITVNSGDPIWRIVWSEDQFEKRLTSYTKEGFELLTPQVVELPKYKQWIHNKYILEQLVNIPLDSCKELTVNTRSYEPLYVFEDKHGNPLPPKWEAIKFLINSINALRGDNSGLVRYKDPESFPESALEAQMERIAKIEEELFGNESDVGDALAHNQAVIVPTNYGDEK